MKIINRVAVGLLLFTLVTLTVQMWSVVIVRAGYRGVTSGVVVDVQERLKTVRSSKPDGFTMYEDQIYYHPVVSYEVDGESFIYEDFVGAHKAGYRVGQSVCVQYDLDNPERSILYDYNLRLSLTIVFSVITSIVVWIVLRRKIVAS